MNEETTRKGLEQSPGTPGILVADDDQEVRQLLRDILEERGYKVFEAKDGKETIKQLGQQLVDLVILDLVMPEQEGIETIRFLRRGCPDVKVIAISGAFGGALLECAQALGAHAVLKKPFSCESVISQVERLLGETAESCAPGSAIRGRAIRRP